MNKYLYIGVLSGTSLDAVDVALISFEPISQHYSQLASIRLLSSLSYPIPKPYRERCLAISEGATEGESLSIDEFGALDVEAGELFAKAVVALLEAASVKAADIRAIGSHGQNLRHCPNNTPPFTLQIGDPNVIAERTGIPVVADFRRRDIAAGGKGAPLAPGFHNAVFRSSDKNRVIVNIGGIANITVLPKDLSLPPKGFDTGPGNCLMDAWIGVEQGADFDKEGRFALSGKSQSLLLEAFLNDPYFKLSPPKSTGREMFNLNWLNEKINQMKIKFSAGSSSAKDFSSENFTTGNFLAEDIQATLLQLTARTINDAIQSVAPPDAEIYICGGGAHNIALMRELEKHLGKTLQTTEALGLSPDWVEAALFAWLAKQTLEGNPGNCPSVTGANRPAALGGIFGWCPDLI